MNNFKPGDRARIANKSHIYEWLVGKECTVFAVGSFETPDGVMDTLIAVDGVSYHFAIYNVDLEPIHKQKHESGSWKEIEVITGWNPLKTEVKNHGKF